MFPEAPPSGGQSGRFRSSVGVGACKSFFSFLFPSPPTSCLSRKQRQKHAHPSARNRLAIPRYWKSRDKWLGRRSVTAVPPSARQCAVTMCWKLAENKTTMCIVALGENENAVLQVVSADRAATRNIDRLSKLDQVPSIIFHRINFNYGFISALDNHRVGMTILSCHAMKEFHLVGLKN